MMSRVVNRIDKELKMLSCTIDNGNFHDGMREGIILAADRAEDESQRIAYELDQQIRLCEETGNGDQASGLRLAVQIMSGHIGT